MWETMNFSCLFLWMLVLCGGSTVTGTEKSESCRASKELDDLCGFHTFQSVKPILNYVDQLQKEQLSYMEERKEINDLREKVKQQKEEGKMNEILIAKLHNSTSSKDNHIKDLQTTNSVLQKTVESVTAEIDKLKSFIKEEFAKELSKIDPNAPKLHYCGDHQNNITISKYAAQMMLKEATLKLCQLTLNETQAQFATNEEALKESQEKLKENQDELKKQKDVILQKERKEAELEAQIDRLKVLMKSKEQGLESCELSLNKTQNVVKEYKDQLKNQNETIALNSATISQLNTDIKLKDKKLKENNITISEYAAQMIIKETTFNRCQLSLNETQSVVLDYKDQLENAKKTFAENTKKISQIQAQVTSNEEPLKKSQGKLKDNQDESKKQKEKKKAELEVHIKEKDQLKPLIKLKEEGLKSWELSLNKTQNITNEYKEHLQNKNNTIALNSTTISQLNLDIKLEETKLNETQAHLEENQDELKDQKEIIHQIKEKETELIPTSCTSFGDSNSVHNIKLPNIEAFPVLCNSEIAGPGWTVIQQRINGGEDFYRNWTTYKNGFGNFTGDFFLGLEKIHRLTSNTPQELYIHMEAFKVENYGRLSFFARYDNFSIAGEDDKYRLRSLGSFSGNAQKDSMRYHEHQPFSTFDNDNGGSSDNCAQYRHAGWWLKMCSDCNLNGKYVDHEVNNCESIWWMVCYSLKTIKMLIRPRGK